MSSVASFTLRHTRSIEAPSPWRKAAVMVGRCLRLSRRDIDTLMTSITLPVILMLLFVYLFGGAINVGTKYVTYVVPGVLLLCAGFGASLTATSVARDMTGGIIDRFRSMDIGGASLLAGHVVASTIRNLVSSALVFGVAFLIGFRPGAAPLDWLAAVALLALFIVAISWFAACIGLLARSAEAASGFSFLVMFLPYASSAFVPVKTMPGWIQPFARHQPVTPVIETLRGLLLGTPIGNNAWLAVAWCAAILVASVVASNVLFRLRTR